MFSIEEVDASFTDSWLATTNDVITSTLTLYKTDFSSTKLPYASQKYNQVLSTVELDCLPLTKFELQYSYLLTDSAISTPETP